MGVAAEVVEVAAQAGPVVNMVSLSLLLMANIYFITAFVSVRFVNNNLHKVAVLLNVNIARERINY